MSLKLIQVSHIPLNIYKNIPYPFKIWPISLKAFQGLNDV